MRAFSGFKSALLGLALSFIASAAFAACPAGWTGFGTCLTAGTAATQNTGTTGATIPFLNGNNTYSGTANFTGTFEVGGFTMTFPGLSATLLYSGGALGTPASGVGTNLTGTAAGLTAGNASQLLSATWASPAAIGSGSPAAGNFTTLGATGLLSTAASATGGAGLNLPQGSAPTSPNNGDLWMTSSGMFYRSAGTTTGPLGTGGGGSFPSGTAGNIAGWAATGTTGAAFSLLNGLTANTSNQTLALTVPNKTVSASCKTQLDGTGCTGLSTGDMGALVGLTGSGQTLTLSAATATGNGMWQSGQGFSVMVGANSWTLTNSTTLTLQYCNFTTTLLPGTSVTFVADADGSHLDCVPGAQVATTTSLGSVMPDGSTITISGGVISATTGGGGGTITLTGPVTGSGTSTIATTIGAGQVTDANRANMNANTASGNFGASAGVPADNTMPSCSGNNDALNYTAGGGTTAVGCKTDLAELALADQTVSGGANVTVLAQAAGSITVDCGARPNQYIPNTGAFTITAPANDGSCYLDVENGAGAGAITLSGFSPNTMGGATVDTTSGHNFRLVISRVHGHSSIFAIALQ